MNIDEQQVIEQILDDEAWHGGFRTGSWEEHMAELRQLAWDERRHKLWQAAMDEKAAAQEEE